MRDLQEYFDLEVALTNSVNPVLCQHRMDTLLRRLNLLVEELPAVDIILELEFTCDFKGLYEAVVNNLRLSLIELQHQDKKVKNLKRERLLNVVRRMETTFGIESEQFSDAILELNRFDDMELKERANKYRDFVLSNNERPTKAFCLLGKENNLVDDLEQIKDSNGVAFVDDLSRKEYIRNFYGELYKKKLDRLIRIEDFLGADLVNEGWVIAKTRFWLRWPTIALKLGF